MIFRELEKQFLGHELNTRGPKQGFESLLARCFRVGCSDEIEFGGLRSEGGGISRKQPERVG